VVAAAAITTQPIEVLGRRNWIGSRVRYRMNRIANAEVAIAPSMSASTAGSPWSQPSDAPATPEMTNAT
jgi:hypothetical protein